MGRKIVDKTGEIAYNNNGIKMEIINFNGQRDIDIKFENGFISKHKRYGNFKKGNVSEKCFDNRYGETNINHKNEIMKTYGMKLLII